ncbi:MAG: endonuclease domain-containing protein [Alphaproteobacteria bacterium]|nr:endonuclease domain-containing protein [Alphaproteobacteria bacterium]
MAERATIIDIPLSLNPSPQWERESAPAQGEGIRRTRSDTKRARFLRKNMTDAEIKLWQKLKRNQLGVRFRRQYSIPPYIVDFYCPKQKLIIEVDGGQHNDSHADQKRSEFLERKGNRVLRFWNNEVLDNTEGVLEKIMRELQNPLSLNPSPRGERESALAQGEGSKGKYND